VLVVQLHLEVSLQLLTQDSLWTQGAAGEKNGARLLKITVRQAAHLSKDVGRVEAMNSKVSDMLLDVVLEVFVCPDETFEVVQLFSLKSCFFHQLLDLSDFLKHLNDGDDF